MNARLFSIARTHLSQQELNYGRISSQQNVGDSAKSWWQPFKTAIVLKNRRHAWSWSTALSHRYSIVNQVWYRQSPQTRRLLVGEWLVNWPRCRGCVDVALVERVLRFLHHVAMPSPTPSQPQVAAVQHMELLGLLARRTAFLVLTKTYETLFEIVAHWHFADTLNERDI